jgi:CRP/FNR family transcriptional regulator, anaerobic regulatory protein
MDDWKQRAVKAFPHLLELSDQERSAILDTMGVGVYPVGTVMIEQGRRCRGAALVLSGAIRVYKLSDEGREITLYRVGCGETCILAVSCLLGGVDYPVIAEVEEDAEVAMMPIDVLRQAMLRSEPWQRFVFSSMARSMIDVLNVLDEVAFRSMDARLAARLLQCELGKIEMTHEQLAADMGTAREVVSRLLKEMENRKFVQLKRGAVIILNRGALEQIAGY